MVDYLKPCRSCQQFMPNGLRVCRSCGYEFYEVKTIDGKNRQGSKNGASKLNEDDVRYIRKHYCRRGSVALSRQFGVDRSTVRNAYEGVTWGWLE